MKVAFFVCITAQGKILTMDNLIKSSMVMGNRCILCKRSGENVGHLLLHCPVAICSFCSEVSDAEEDEKIVLMLTKKFQDFRIKLGMLPLLVLMWHVRRERDRRMFVEQELSIERFKTQFLGSLFYWLFLNENRPPTYKILWINCLCNLTLQTVPQPKNKIYRFNSEWEL